MGGEREKEGEKGVRHAGCMATQEALLYQEAPVGVFLPKSAEKPKAMPNSTSANRAAITTLIDVFYSASYSLRAAMLGGRVLLKRILAVFRLSPAVSECLNILLKSTTTVTALYHAACVCMCITCSMQLSITTTDHKNLLYR